jgi:small conductance mechanosensitive channel
MIENDRYNMETLTDSLFSLDMFGQTSADLLLGFATQILAGIITIIAGFWLAGKASRLVVDSISKIDRIDITIVPMIGALIRYAGMTLTLVVALGKFGVETTSIIAVLGAAGLAIGLALQGTLSNVAAGLMLVFLRPFKIGDWIEAAGMSGTVREIGLFTTIIDTFDRVYISVPNSAIWSANIINHSRYEQRRLDLDIGIAYESNLDDAEAALMSLAQDPRILPDPAPRFLVVSYADSAIIVRLRVYANYADFFDLGHDLHRQLKDAMAAHNVSIPYPQRVIRYADDKGADGVNGGA